MKISGKKIILNIAIILGLIVIFKYDKISRYFAHQRYYKYLENLHIIKHCYVPHPDIKAIFAQEGFDYYAYNNKVINDGLAKLNNPIILTQSLPKIPRITHKVYFTGKNKPNKLDDFYIEELKLHFNNFNNLGGEWEHNIWTNQPDLFPKEVLEIDGVKLRSINELSNHPLYANVLEILKLGEEFKPHLTEATDFVRLMVVQKFGGIYTDMDYEIYRPEVFFDWMKKFDFIGARETMHLESFYTNAFFASKANHPILNYAIEKRFRNYNSQNIPDYIKYPCKIYDKILLNGPVLMALSYFAKNNIDGNVDIILPSWMMMNVDFSRFKNNHCELSKITAQNFSKTQQELDKLIAEFTHNPNVPDWQYKNNLSQNIYYTLKNKDKYPIIGTDASCGTWIVKDEYHKNVYYWKWPWNK